MITDTLMAEDKKPLFEDVEIIEDVLIQEQDDFRQIVRICRPANHRFEKPSPALVMFHGGGYRIGEPSHCGGLAEHLVRHLGITVLCPSYRLYAGKPTFPNPLWDCSNALRWVRQHTEEWNINPARIALGGQSAGCYLSALSMLTPDDPDLGGGGNIQGDPVTPVCFISYWGPLDFVSRWFDNGEQPGAEIYLFGKNYTEAPDLYHRTGVLQHVRPGLPPALFIYGAQDRVVHPRQGELGLAAWKANGNHAELCLYDNIGHDTKGDNRESTEAYLRKTVDFLSKYL